MLVRDCVSAFKNVVLSSASLKLLFEYLRGTHLQILLRMVTMWVIEWSSFQKEEMIKGKGYWTSHAEGTQGRQRTNPLFISLYLEWKTISWVSSTTCSLVLSCWVPDKTSAVFGLWSFWWLKFVGVRCGSHLTGALATALGYYTKSKIKGLCSFQYILINWRKQ